MSQVNTEVYIQDWNEREDIASQMVPLITKLYKERGVVTRLFSQSLFRKDPVNILKSHRFSRLIIEHEISVRETFPILQALAEMELCPCTIDIGRLYAKYEKTDKSEPVGIFVQKELANINTGIDDHREDRDVVLYGFGRIGRLLARILVNRSGASKGLRLRAVVVRNTAKKDLAKRASLLRRDSVHGAFDGTIIVVDEEDAIIVNGNYIKFIFADSPEEVDYTAHGIDRAILIDNTGKWRDEEGLSKHLKSKGVDKVVLTAPGKGDLPNIVYGINQHVIKEEDRIITAASCTTNAIAPTLKVINDKFGIVNGHVETCHSFTNDQNLIDNYHKSDRRGRSAPLNMVITETGAAKAVAKTLPELAGKLTGNAIRVPTPNVSLAILNLTLSKETTKEEMNTFLRDKSLDSVNSDQIGYVNSPEIVSSDFVGNKFSGIVDGLATIVDGSRAVVYVWYDNEYGYSRQVNRIAEYLCGLRLKTYPERY
ncbi:glyceraldehyde-3-phosphate dehydrogenase, type I [Denitrovibrio acetiphilus DSM 12809]|uniref:Glyceraldehyde-3-phosphate dehydrogenase n=1 Tax=Denitrovibrio acetiphilus (strain DSM 12809 / NBRC 114555 / N2460) TaxID=522772 RepID=D4H8I3_DENA2|nr:glyceraldehyde-3-phosphate dehydrogenase [Denitrovibrio acetiphilus]ADD68332.1 glyceraldehyde-3-phosphate dehydrogenase, type I [Denitrovibrio acetiphilus DSM 12809]